MTDAMQLVSLKMAGSELMVQLQLKIAVSNVQEENLLMMINLNAQFSEEMGLGILVKSEMTIILSVETDVVQLAL